MATMALRTVIRSMLGAEALPGSATCPWASLAAHHLVQWQAPTRLPLDDGTPAEAVVTCLGSQRERGPRQPGDPAPAESARRGQGPGGADAAVGVEVADVAYAQCPVVGSAASLSWGSCHAPVLAPPSCWSPGAHVAGRGAGTPPGPANGVSLHRGATGRRGIADMFCAPPEISAGAGIRLRGVRAIASLASSGAQKSQDAASSAPGPSRGPEPPQARQLVVTACGPDRPGLVSALTKRILDRGGNVEQSRMARLAGEFSIIMLTSVDASVPRIAEDLKSSLSEVEGLQITTRWARKEPLVQRKAQRKFRRILLWGADNPGLVYNVTEFLAANKINIENLETDVDEAPFGGTTLFRMEGVIAMPVGMPTQSLIRSLDVLQNSLGVVIELRNMDPEKMLEDLQKWREQAKSVGGASRYSILAQEGPGVEGDRLI